VTKLISRSLPGARTDCALVTRVLSLRANSLRLARRPVVVGANVLAATVSPSLTLWPTLTRTACKLIITVDRFQEVTLKWLTSSELSFCGCSGSHLFKLWLTQFPVRSCGKHCHSISYVQSRQIRPFCFNLLLPEWVECATKVSVAVSSNWRSYSQSQVKKVKTSRVPELQHFSR